MLATARCGNPLNMSTSADMRSSGALSTKVGTPGPSDGNPISSISDGTSNTIMFTELAGRGLAIYIKGRNVGSVPSTSAALVGMNVMTPNSTSGFGALGDLSQFPRGTWADQNGVTYLRGYTVATTGTNVNATTGCSIINVINHASPYSFHSGGVNTLRCDGSVTFMKESISPQVLLAAVTRNGGEVGGLDNYADRSSLPIQRKRPGHLPRPFGVSEGLVNAALQGG
jgi:prepilin-type processing-associated H-X9-DG protein